MSYSRSQACNQIGQLQHVGEYKVRFSRRKPRFESRVAGVRAAGEGEHAHAGRLGRLHAGRAVLDDEAVLRLCAHRAGGVKEEIGRRLAVRHHGGAEQMRLQQPEQAGDVERQRMRSGGPEEATQQGEPSVGSMSAMPGIGFSSLAKLRINSTRMLLRCWSLIRTPKSRPSISRTLFMLLPRKCS